MPRHCASPFRNPLLFDGMHINVLYWWYVHRDSACFCAVGVVTAVVAGLPIPAGFEFYTRRLPEKKNSFVPKHDTHQRGKQLGGRPKVDEDVVRVDVFHADEYMLRARSAVITLPIFLSIVKTECVHVRKRLAALALAGSRRLRSTLAAAPVLSPMHSFVEYGRITTPGVIAL